MQDDIVGIITALVIIAIYFAIFGIPIMQILKKAGYSRVWVLIAFLPVINLIFLWVFAFSHWPIEGRRT